MLPNFLVIGSAQSGTTSIYHIFRQHPQIFMSEKKELHFFINEHWYRRGMEFYERHFPDSQRSTPAVGEATPGYICYPQVPARIRQHLPDVRMILTVRNPVQRAWTQYWRRRAELFETASFEQVVAEDLVADFDPARRGYFSRGFYMRYIRRYLEHFDRDQLLVLLFDDLQQAPVGFYRRCFAFLGVDPDFYCPAMERRFNSSALWSNPLFNYFYHHPERLRPVPPRLRRVFCLGPRRPRKLPPMDPEMRQRLIDFYRDANRELGDFLGRDLEHWNR